MNHQLTDRIISENFTPGYEYINILHINGEICVGFNNDDLRAAADWQLEQVIGWIQKNLEKQGRFGRYVYENPFYGSPIDAEKFLADLRQAMRPQQQEDN